jgi:nucleoside-diphosphate-sugar epimerase
MRVLITGAGGFIGQRLAAALVSQEKIVGRNGTLETIEKLVLLDVEVPDSPGSKKVVVCRGDISNQQDVQRATDGEVDLVFHLAAVVSAQAEEDFDLGYRVNNVGMWNLLESCRHFRRPPRVVYTSSTACFGGELPDVVPDSWPLTPQTSYGIQKVMGELLLQDFTRKGFVDGRGIRLPTIIVRPSPNKAASTFASSIIREPLANRPVVCPVRPDSRMYVLSPRMAIRSLIRAAELPMGSFGTVPTLTLPGLGVSIGDLVGALERIAGPQAAQLIEWKLDPTIQGIVGGWPANFRAERSRLLGFQSDGSVEEIIRGYIEDET